MQTKEILDKKDVENLLDQDDKSYKISMYFTMHVYGEETEQNHIAYKNGFTEAINKLEEEYPDYKHDDGYKENLKLAEDLINNTTFWQSQNYGLAVFLSDKIFEVYLLPVKFSEGVYVMRQFYTRPLYSASNSHADYFILDLSMNHNRLLRCSIDGFKEVKPDVAYWLESAEELLELKDRKQELQLHPSGSGSMGFHGHSKWKELKDHDKQEYFNWIDDAIGEYFQKKITAVFAGTRENFDYYKSQSKSIEFYDDFIEGDNKSKSSEQLWKESLEIVSRKKDMDTEEKIEMINENLGGSDRVSSDIKDIVIKADNGQVDTLIIDPDEQVFGKFSREQQDVNLSGSTDSIDLISFAADRTFQNGGTVLVQDKSNIPGKHGIIAIFRY